MAVRFTRDKLILYFFITAGLLLHWMHDDLGAHPGFFAVNLLNNVWQVIYVVGMHLLFFEYVLPVVMALKIHRAISIAASVIIYLGIFAVGLAAWRQLGVFTGVYHAFRNYSDFGDALSRSARFTPGPFLVFAVTKLFYDYTQMKYEGQKAQVEKKQAELLFLRSQVNPHFLFNTLNNIYSLSQHQPELVSESVLRLSKILRYLLYETGGEFITIDKEIKILTDYIDLEKLRYSENVAIEFQHDIDDFTVTLPPLLLIPLVENAFKHGVSVTRGNRFVTVRCHLLRDQLQFAVTNSSYKDTGYDETKGNIGLNNLSRRLELLYRDFSLTTQQKDSVFTADLKINLSSHVKN